jgi:hypothetical protein
LEQQAQALITTGGNTYERGRAHRLLDAVRDFLELAERKRELEEAAEEGETEDDDDTTAATGDNREPIGSGLAKTNDSPYEAQGWLLAVTSTAENSAPPFTVVDADGLPLAFVSPAPGLNLRRYIDQEVGIVGEIGFSVSLNDKQYPHVVAHQVVELARQRGKKNAVAASRPKSPWIRYRTAAAEMPLDE